MNIIVCMKQTVDLQQVRIRKETREPVMDNIPLTMGNIDKNALEEAIRIKEKHEGKVLVVSAGQETLQETVKEVLAMGADEAVLVIDLKLEGIESAVVAETLAKAIRKVGEYDLVILGEGSADNYSGQVGPRLAELLDLPLVAFVSSLEIKDNRITARRNLEDCVEIVEVELPAVVTVMSEINEARIPSVTQILKAGRKPKQEFTLQELEINLSEMENRVKTLSNLAPLQERKQIIFNEGIDKDVADLIKAITNEGIAVR